VIVDVAPGAVRGKQPRTSFMRDAIANEVRRRIQSGPTAFYSPATLSARHEEMTFWQMNSASKAAQLGARLAAVSDPVARGLPSLTVDVIGESGAAGDPTMPTYTITCNGATESCGDTYEYDRFAMEAIVFGRGAGGQCNAVGGYFAGMCSMFPGLRPEHVPVVYTSPGNANGAPGYVGRPQGPVATIQVSVRAPALPKLFGFGPTLFGPPATAPTTATAEAMSSGAQ
jgi:hypothetical protein